MDQTVDPLERARAGDRAAFQALVDLWGTPVFRLAWMLAGDRTQAALIARRTFLACWRDLPTLHSRRAFRPWLLGTVIEIAREDGLGPAPGMLEPITDEGARIVAALRYGIGLRLGEVAETAVVGLRDARRALAAVAGDLQQNDEELLRRTLADELRGIELEGGFYEMALSRALARVPEGTAARALTAPLDAVGRAACSAQGLSAITGRALGERSALAPGDRFRARGRLGDKGRARVEIVVTRVERPLLLTWTEHAHPLLRPASIEIRYALALEQDGADTRATLSLDGIARPEMMSRVYPDLAESVRPAMHRGLEALAARALA
jgi:hypothetical protein